MSTDPRYGDYLIDTAIEAGKFPASRRDYYRRLYASNASGTAALLEMLEPALPPSLGTRLDEGLPGDWFPELGRGYAAPTVRELSTQSVAASSPVPAATGDGLPDQWFPEARRNRQAHAAAVEGRGHVLHGHD